MHALLDAVGRALRDAEQLDAEAEFVGRLDVGERHALDALDVDGLGRDARAEGERREDRELVRRVEAADVERRVGLGVAEPSAPPSDILEGQLFALHAREDVIAGAVENAIDAVDRIAGESLAQRLDDRNAAGDRRLEGERDTLLLGELGEIQTMRGEQRLVGGDDGLAMCKRRLDAGARRALPRRRSARRKGRCCRRRRA